MAKGSLTIAQDMRSGRDAGGPLPRALTPPLVARALGSLANPAVLGDELLGGLARLVVRALRVGRLHEVGAGSVELAGDAVVERQLAAPHRVGDDPGRVGRVPHLELELELERHVAERLAL